MLTNRCLITSSGYLGHYANGFSAFPITLLPQDISTVRIGNASLFSVCLQDSQDHKRRNHTVVATGKKAVLQAVLSWGICLLLGVIVCESSIERCARERWCRGPSRDNVRETWGMHLFFDWGMTRVKSTFYRRYEYRHDRRGTKRVRSVYINHFEHVYTLFHRFCEARALYDANTHSFNLIPE